MKRMKAPYNMREAVREGRLLARLINMYSFLQVRLETSCNSRQLLGGILMEEGGRKCSTFLYARS